MAHNSNAGQTNKYVWCRLSDEDWARVDALRGQMSRREWVRQAFYAQLMADEREGTVGGLVPEDNPYDGGMPFGLPRPDPFDAEKRVARKKARRGQAARGVKMAIDAATELRHIQVISLAQAGRSHAEIAEITGYKKGSISRILSSELNKYKMFSVQEYREWALRKHLEQVQALQATIDSPGPLVSATGNVVTGADGQPLPDKAERTRALTEQRKVVESIRRAVGTDAPSQRHITLEQQALDSTLKSIMAAIASKQMDAIEGVVDADVVDDYELAMAPVGGQVDAETEQADERERLDGEKDALADAGELKDERDGEGYDGGYTEHVSTS